MRSVRIVVRQVAGSVPALVAASVLGSACGPDPSPPPAGTGGSASVPVTSGGSGGSISGGSISGGSISGGSGPRLDLGGSGSGAVGAGGDLPFGCEGYELQLPDAGHPAVAGEICTVEVEPVVAHGAARVALEVKDGDVAAPARGTLTLEKALRESVRGEPSLEIIGASDSRLLAARISELTPTDDGYSFEITWPEDSLLQAQDLTRVQFRTALDLSCEGETTRLVHAVSELHLCGGFASVPSSWASAGDQCVVCRVIAELAASPIIPEPRRSGLPLGQAMRARIVELAKVGGSVVLFAENDGGSASGYEWHAVGGTIERVADDVVVFRRDPLAPTSSLQVAIMNDDGVAVVSYAYTGGVH
jgi:hypothetical protein